MAFVEVIILWFVVAVRIIIRLVQIALTIFGGVAHVTGSILSGLDRLGNRKRAEEILLWQQSAKAPNYGSHAVSDASDAGLTTSGSTLFTSEQDVDETRVKLLIIGVFVVLVALLSWFNISAMLFAAGFIIYAMYRGQKENHESACTAPALQSGNQFDNRDCSSCTTFRTGPQGR